MSIKFDEYETGTLYEIYMENNIKHFRLISIFDEEVGGLEDHKFIQYFYPSFCSNTLINMLHGRIRLNIELLQRKLSHQHKAEYTYEEYEDVLEQLNIECRKAQRLSIFHITEDTPVGYYFS